MAKTPLSRERVPRTGAGAERRIVVIIVLRETNLSLAVLLDVPGFRFGVAPLSLHVAAVLPSSSRTLALFARPRAERTLSSTSRAASYLSESIRTASMSQSFGEFSSALACVVSTFFNKMSSSYREVMLSTRIVPRKSRPLLPSFPERAFFVFTR